jgi:alpha-beta hydrolase superfamily lysophospholipase
MPTATHKLPRGHCTGPQSRVVHSDTDTVIPFEMGKRVYAAASTPKQMIIAHNFKHDALLKEPSNGWWNPVLKFMRD